MSTNTSEQANAAAAPEDLLGSEIVWTPEQERFAQQICRWIQLDLPGGCGYGVQRSGKTFALRGIAAQAASYFGRALFISMLRIQKGLSDREGALVGEWLQQENALSNESSASRMRKRLRLHIIEQAQMRGASQLLVIVDEAQYLTRDHLQQLIYWGDLLQTHALRVFILLVGQPELRLAMESYFAMQELQIVGRFFERSYEFQGILPSEIPLVMKAHETEVLAPDGSKQPPAVAALFPDAWAAGWRFSSWAPVVAEGIAQVAARSGLPRDQRIPMQHLRSTLLGLLLYVIALKDPYAEISVENVIKALCDTGIHETWAKYAALSRK